MKKIYLLFFILITNLLVFNLTAEAKTADELLPAKTFKDFESIKNEEQANGDWNRIKAVFDKQIDDKDTAKSKQDLELFRQLWLKPKENKSNSGTIKAIIKSLKLDSIKLSALSWGDKWEDRCVDTTFMQFKAHLIYSAARTALNGYTLKSAAAPAAHKEAVPDPTKNYLNTGFVVMNTMTLEILLTVLFFLIFIILIINSIRNKEIKALKTYCGTLEDRIKKLEPKQIQGNGDTDQNDTKPLTAVYKEALKQELLEALKQELKDMKPASDASAGGKSIGNTHSNSGTGTNRNNKQPPVAVDPFLKTIHASLSTDKVFLQDSIQDNYMPNETFFTIRPYKANPNQGELNINPEAYAAVAADKETNLQDCKCIGMGYKIKNVTAGKVEKNSNRWVIKDPIKVEFED